MIARLFVRVKLIAAAFTAIVAITLSAAAYDDHTPPAEIPNQNVVHSETQFGEFLDLMLTASDPENAFEIARAKFGSFPLRFGGDNFRVMIVSFRHHYIHPRRNCAFPMIKAEYIQFSPLTGKVNRVGWIFIYPQTGPIVKDDINGMHGITLEEAMTNTTGFFRGRNMSGGVAPRSRQLGGRSLDQRGKSCWIESEVHSQPWWLVPS